jgi:transcriptional regulator with XRE-family HTH domain
MSQNGGAISQTDLAAMLGVTKSLISHIEAGKRQPTEEQYPPGVG